MPRIDTWCLFIDNSIPVSVFITADRRVDFHRGFRRMAVNLHHGFHQMVVNLRRDSGAESLKSLEMEQNAERRPGAWSNYGAHRPPSSEERLQNCAWLARYSCTGSSPHDSQLCGSDQDAPSEHG